MKDLYGRGISYIRVSITDKCNLRCRYCMPEEGVEIKEHTDMLSLEEMTEVIRCCSKYGIDRVRITGGEPLVKKGIINFIKNINNIDGIKKINITTNGTLLKNMAKDLKKAGVDGINISLDTLDPDKYRYITRCGNLNDVLEGIDTCLGMGFNKIKINTVLIKGFNDNEIESLVEMTKDKPLYVRFIELMSVGEAKELDTKYLSTQTVLDRIKDLKPVEYDKKDGGPAVYYKKEGYLGYVGLITPISSCFCEYCNRIRFTSDGKLMPCLHSDIKVDIFDVAKKRDIEGICKSIEKVIQLKPQKHKLADHVNGQDRYMSQIGG